MAKKSNKVAVKLSYSLFRRGGLPAARARIAPVILSLAARSFHGSKVCLLLLMLFHLGSAPAFAQVSREYQLKAVFLWRLAQFTEWPGDAFERADSPILICVLGENPFGDALDTAVRGETANGRKLVVQHSRGVEQAKACHIAYITGPVARQAKELSAAFAGRSILTIRDFDSSERSYDTMIRFVTEQNKIKLRINVKTVTAARLVLDPRLLRAAEIVGHD